MDRRAFLRKLSAVPLSIEFFGSENSSESVEYPSIREGYLEDYGWIETGNPQLPDELPNEEIEDESRWGLVAYADDHVTPAVREQTDGLIDTQLMSMVAAKATDLGYWFPPDSEFGETRVGIDGVAEEVCEEVIFTEMNNLDSHRDYHIKTVQQIIELTVGQLPYVGEGVSTSLGYLWDTPESINTRDGKDSYLAQYLASKTLRANGEEYEVDYRGLYADWFYEGNLYAALAFYPQDKETLSKAVLELTGVDLSLDDGITFERETIKMLSGIGE